MKILLACCFIISGCTNISVSDQPILEVGFSPPAPNQIGCTERIVNHIKAAKHEILVQAYSFTSPEIGDALIEAHKKIPKVKVQIILDKSNEHDKHSIVEKMLAYKVPVWYDKSHSIAHNKVMIFDHEEVETGSANYTKAMRHSNAENCLFIRDKQLTADYTANWFRHLDHSIRAN